MIVMFMFAMKIKYLVVNINSWVLDSHKIYDHVDSHSFLLIYLSYSRVCVLTTSEYMRIIL